MNRIYPIALLGALLCGFPCTTMAQDTVFNRVVTVERDYQPEINQAEMVLIQPAILQIEVDPNPVVYSTFSTPLSIGFNLHPLKAAETRFTPPTQLGGMIDGAAGYRNTHLDFYYKLREKKNWSVDVYTNHDAYWGKDALSVSRLGTQATHHFSGVDVYMGVEGENEAFAYQPTFGWRTLWNANTKIGIRSTNNGSIQYRVQTGYEAFIASNYAIEHQVCSHLDIAWQADYHQAGLKAYVQNNFYSAIHSTIEVANSPQHAIRMEPFYEYKSLDWRIHAGVNLDMNIGNGNYLSTIDNLIFAPSPNIEVEGHVLNNMLHPYLNAKGKLDVGTMEEYLGYNRFLDIPAGLLSRELRNYTPADIQLGMKIRPINTLLIDVYGGYAYTIAANHMFVGMDSISVTDYSMRQTNYQSWKIGAAVHYHYRDIVELNASGNYYFWVAKQTVYDRPDWDIKARLDVHINSKWSIYSDNYFAGSRMAATAQGDKRIQPIVSLNIGGQYAINRWLMVYAQVNDYLNRRDEIFYGYKSQGIHFLLGVKYKF